MAETMPCVMLSLVGAIFPDCVPEPVFSDIAVSLVHAAVDTQVKGFCGGPVRSSVSVHA